MPDDLLPGDRARDDRAPDDLLARRRLLHEQDLLGDVVRLVRTCAGPPPPVLLDAVLRGRRWGRRVPRQWGAR